MMDSSEGGLAPTTWCGIVALALGAAALFVHTWVGLAVLGGAGVTFVVACLREGRPVPHG
jgi:hypothetical protein